MWLRVRKREGLGSEVCFWRTSPFILLRYVASTRNIFMLKAFRKSGAHALQNPFTIFAVAFLCSRIYGRRKEFEGNWICELRHMLGVQLSWVTFFMLLSWVLNEAVLWLKQISLIFLPCTFQKQTTLSHIAVWVLTELSMHTRLL